MLYLDPGTGSLVIQVVIAAAITVRIAGRNTWTRLKGLFSRDKTRNTPDD